MTDFKNIFSRPTLGLGCWAIGGPFYADGRAVGWGEVDDAVSRRAIDVGLDHGVRHFDTAQAYGTGHSETVLGTALKGRDDVAIATKFGIAIDPDKKALTGALIEPELVRESLHASMKRLGRDHIELVLLHQNELPVPDALPMYEMLDGMVDAGDIGAHGWSTDFPDSVEALADNPHFTAVEHAMNVFHRAEYMVPTVEKHNLLALIRSPLAMGILGGKYDKDTQFSTDEIRGTDDGWKAYFKDGRITDRHLAELAATREILTSNGRSLAQGAIAWLWARSHTALPIPGFRTPEQVTDLCGALEHGPLTPTQMDEIEAVLTRPKEGPPTAR